MSDPIQIMLAGMDEKITYLRDRLYRRKLAGKVDEKTEPLQAELKQLIDERDSKLKQLRKERIEKNRAYEYTLLNMTVDFHGSVKEAREYMAEKGYTPMKVYSYSTGLWYHSVPDKTMKQMLIQDWPITRSMKKQKEEQEDNAKVAYGFAKKSIKKTRKSPRKVKKSPRKNRRSARK